MTDDARRPIAQRQRGYAKMLTRWMAGSKITPNMISFMSIVFAIFGGLCFYAQGVTNSVGDRTMLLLGAALFCQLRLLANMLDGMVAVEAGKGGPDGPIWNELPDRFADIFFLVGAGYGVAVLGLADASLGWAGAVAAVMTAYVREVGKGAGAPPDFTGPMAKPHRMFVMTMAALISTLEPLWNWRGELLHYALWIVVIGSIFTMLNRARRAIKALNAHKG